MTAGMKESVARAVRGPKNTVNGWGYVHEIVASDSDRYSSSDKIQGQESHPWDRIHEKKEDEAASSSGAHVAGGEKEDWTFVSRGNRGKRGGRSREQLHIPWEKCLLVTPSTSSSNQDPSVDTAVDLNTAHRTRDDIRRILHEDAHFISFAQRIHSMSCAGIGGLPSKIRCLGIGSPSSSFPSKYQIALVLTLAGSESEGAYVVSAYDPIMCETEKKALEMLGIHQCQASEKGNYEVTEPTLFFMPHCDRHLYEEVMRQNEGRWDNLVIIGNSFAHYHLIRSSSDPPALPPAMEMPLGSFQREERAFNDLHVLHFPQHVWRRWPLPITGCKGEVVAVDLKSNRLKGRAEIKEDEVDGRFLVQFAQDNTTAHVRRGRLRGIVSRPALVLSPRTSDFRRMAATQLWEDDVVLEIGCSLGECTQLLSIHAKEVIACDVSETVIKECKKIVLPGPAPVTWLCTDVFSLPHWRRLCALRRFTSVFIDIGGDRQGAVVFDLLRFVLRDIKPSLVCIKSEQIAELNPTGPWLEGLHLEAPQYGKHHEKRIETRMGKVDKGGNQIL